MPVKDGMKLVVESPNEFHTATMIQKNLTNIMLSKTVRHRNIYCMSPLYRRYKQAKLSYAIRNRNSETRLARVVTRKVNMRGTPGP